MDKKKYILWSSSFFVLLLLGLLIGRCSTEDAKREIEPDPSASVPESTPAREESLLGKGSSALSTVFRTLNHNSIEFYGRAVDQHGDGVAGAYVKGSVMVNTGMSSGTRVLETTTDPDGYFQFAGASGQDLGILIKKAGYEYHPLKTSFSYTHFEADHKRHEPDSKNPVELKLWKLKGAEQLVHFRKEWRFPILESPVRLDLEKAELNGEFGDLIVEVERDPLEMDPGMSGYRWRVSLEAVGGGLIRADGLDYYNEAPREGYQPRLEFVQEPQNPHDRSVKWKWKYSVEGNFFITSRNGKNYAYVKLKVRPKVDRNIGDNEGGMTAEAWLNPNSSRNLEFDKYNVIKPKLEK